MKKKQSVALDVMDLVWLNSAASSRNSYKTLNRSLSNILTALIELGFVFDENDYAEIWKRYRPSYWAYVSLNGHHYGESFYQFGTLAADLTFCKSYEKHTGREPFILNNNRLYEGFEFIYNNLYFRVSGWTKDNKRIKAVGYKNRMREGKRTLVEFDKSKWLLERKNIKAF